MDVGIFVTTTVMIVTAELRVDGVAVERECNPCRFVYKPSSVHGNYWVRAQLPPAEPQHRFLYPRRPLRGRSKATTAL